MSAEFHDVALVGFAPSERATFETFFRLVSSRRPRPFRAVDKVETAHVVFIDAGKDYRLIETSDRLKDHQVLVTFGSVRSSRATRHLDRPINLNAVLLTLDASVTSQNTSQAATPATPVSSAAPTARAATAVRVAPIAIAAPVALNASAVVSTKPVSSVPPIMATPPRARIEPVVSTPQSTSTTPPVVVKPAAAVSPPAFAPPPVSTQNNAAVRSTSQAAATGTPTKLPTAANRAAAPINSATVTQLPPARASLPPQAAPAPTGGVRILVVDDSDVALKFIHNRLSAFGFSVDQCTSGEEALVRVSDGDYAFVFLDVMMAGLDGYQTCKAIKGRRYPAGRAPVVVMLTSRGGTIDKVRGTFAGCDAYLTKPLDEVKMLKVLLKHDPNLADSISTLAAPAPSLPRVASAPGVNPLAASFESLSDRVR